MTKFDLVELIASKTGFTKKDVALIVDALFDAIRDALINHKYIELRGFGSFLVKERKPRTAWNPKTGEKIKVGMKYIPYFKPGTILKQAVMDTALTSPRNGQPSSENTSQVSEPMSGHNSSIE